MFLHNLKYTFKTLFKNGSLIFWTFAFPLVLGTLFYLAFSDVESGDVLDIINIAIVDNQEFKDDEVMKSAFLSLSEENEDQLFNIEYVSEDKAKELLNNKEISGYLELKDKESNIVIKTNGINETIFKSVVDEINEKKKIVSEIAKEEIKLSIASGTPITDYERLYTEIIDMVSEKRENYKDTSSTHLSYMVIEFYTLIAMTCLYCGSLSMYAINNTLANMSAKGKRIAVSSISKFKLLLSSTIASFITELIGLTILFLYIIFVLKVDFGSNISGVILLSVLGTLCGLSFGMMVASVFKVNENSKIGIIIAITMFFSFLSGMMGVSMKYVVEKNAPLVGMINPANLITDGFYSLYYYDTLDRFNTDIYCLIGFTALMFIMSFVSLRRQKYASI